MQFGGADTSPTYRSGGSNTNKKVTMYRLWNDNDRGKTAVLGEKSLTLLRFEIQITNHWIGIEPLLPG